jgi:LysM repeat protein
LPVRETVPPANAAPQPASPAAAAPPVPATSPAPAPPAPVTPARPTPSTGIGLDDPDEQQAPPAPLPRDLPPDALASDRGASERLRQALAMLEAGQAVQARAELSQLLAREDRGLSAEDAAAIRRRLTALSQDMIFSRRVPKNDPLVDVYVVKPGDFLMNVGRQYAVPYELIEQINKVEARKIWAGQKMKVPRGPFHGVVDKSDYRLDLYLNDPEGRAIYVTSFPVGLGENDSTPVGRWRVRAGGKVKNPSWPDPSSGKVYAPDDPANPIGEYWMGLEGLDEVTSRRQGYGIHGTTEPQSIGQQMSLGCIRMRESDLIQVYNMLVEGKSTVLVRP